MVDKIISCLITSCSHLASFNKLDLSSVLICNAVLPWINLFLFVGYRQDSVSETINKDELYSNHNGTSSNMVHDMVDVCEKSQYNSVDILVLVVDTDLLIETPSTDDHGDL